MGELKRNLDKKSTAMPEVAPVLRRQNFVEVEIGYSPEMAVNEAKRCLGCKHRPCVDGCPVGVNIPEFIGLVATSDFAQAYRTITKDNALPAICGRVCPQESQCEARCVRKNNGESVSIGKLERFVADWYCANVHKDASDKDQRKETLETSLAPSQTVAVIGSGPASLTCAAELALRGYAVTVFEAFHVCGGVLVYGIPEFRLPKVIVEQEIIKLKNLGITFATNMVIGRILSIDDLLGEMGFGAVFIGTGAGLPQFLGIDGESALGVYSANEYLTRANLMKAYDNRYQTPLKRAEHVAVIGGGNVAMDAARTALRLGAKKVTVVYRRTFAEMPARLAERHHAIAEGIGFENLTSPLCIETNADGYVVGLTCEKMTLEGKDASGRMAPVPVANSEFCIVADAIIVAVGTRPNPLLAQTTVGLKADAKGLLITDATGMTTREGVFAGGDVVTGAATVILAMGAGKKAANSIHKYLTTRREQ